MIFDKTGTLTEDNIQVSRVETRAGFNQKQALSLAAAIAQHSNHPISRALCQANGSIDQDIVLKDIQEQIGFGISARVVSWHGLMGALKLGSAKFCGTSVTDVKSQAVYLADEHGCLAVFYLQETIKEQARETIGLLKKAHLEVELLSGDQSDGVSEIAQQLGINSFQASCTPQDKLKRLQQLKEQERKILMVGDGLNDGPILASAHVSIAMGKGVPLTLAQADYVLLNGDISQIPFLIRHAQKSMRIIKQNIIWAVIYNVVCIPLAFFGVLNAWMAGLGMALSSLFVIANALRLSRFATKDAD